jgi:AraC-like DNA-binding protein
MDAEPDSDAGWLAALRDREIARALEHIHAAPERDWTVASLAATVGMSRSSFAARFRSLVGEPPLAYVARWRLSLAANWLQRDEQTIAQIAQRLGYASEVALSRAFKRLFKVPPGAYRRRSTAA